MYVLWLTLLALAGGEEKPGEASAPSMACREGRLEVGLTNERASRSGPSAGMDLSLQSEPTFSVAALWIPRS